MAVEQRAFLDTSILVSGLIEADEVPGPAHAIMDAIADGRITRPMTAWHCVLEFYSVATRLPGGLKLDPRLAEQLVREEILARFDVHDIPQAARQRFLDSLVHERVTGGRVYDAHIAEAARLAGAEVVVTDNRRHFVPLMRYGIRVLTAEEFAGAYAS
ncbi:MAG: PIN domain-containing protein [Vicinamibacterales bacterium]